MVDKACARVQFVALHIMRRGNERKPRRIAKLRGVEVVQVSTGGWHCLALDSAGLVYAWGGNEYGQCHVEWDVRCAAERTGSSSFIWH